MLSHFLVESSFSGNDVVLDKARHDDEDDVDENMNNHFLDIMRTSLMTCLRLLVGVSMVFVSS